MKRPFGHRLQFAGREPLPALGLAALRVELTHVHAVVGDERDLHERVLGAREEQVRLALVGREERHLSAQFVVLARHDVGAPGDGVRLVRGLDPRVADRPQRSVQLLPRRTLRAEPGVERGVERALRLVVADDRAHDARHRRRHVVLLRAARGVGDAVQDFRVGGLLQEAEQLARGALALDRREPAGNAVDEREDVGQELRAQHVLRAQRLGRARRVLEARLDPVARAARFLRGPRGTAVEEPVRPRRRERRGAARPQ
jgi:hypothetical protein